MSARPMCPCGTKQSRCLDCQAWFCRAPGHAPHVCGKSVEQQLAEQKLVNQYVIPDAGTMACRVSITSKHGSGPEVEHFCELPSGHVSDHSFLVGAVAASDGSVAADNPDVSGGVQLPSDHCPGCGEVRDERPPADWAFDHALCERLEGAL